MKITREDTTYEEIKLAGAKYISIDYSDYTDRANSALKFPGMLPHDYAFWKLCVKYLKSISACENKIIIDVERDAFINTKDEIINTTLKVFSKYGFDCTPAGAFIYDDVQPHFLITVVDCDGKVLYKTDPNRTALECFLPGVVHSGYCWAFKVRDGIIKKPW